MKTLLSTAAAVLFSISLVACEGGTKKSVTVVPSPQAVPSATLPAVLPTVRVLPPVSTEDPCPRTGVEGSKTLAEGVGFSVNCGMSSGMIVAGIPKALDLDDYRRIKVEADKVLCSMWSQDFIDRRVSWAPPTPGDITFSPADVHTVCSEVGGK